MKKVVAFSIASIFIFFGFLKSLSAQQPSIYDSSFYSKKDRPQQNAFLNNTYNFPSMPRNRWEVGASFGGMLVNGDVPSILPSFGFSGHVRKAFGYLFSLRLQYTNGVAKGLMYQSAAANIYNPAWLDNGSIYRGNLPAGKGYNPNYLNQSGVAIQGNSVYYNHKTNIQSLSIDGVISISNILFHKKDTKLSLYGGMGLGFTAYHTMVNALGADGNNYTNLFNSVIAKYNGAPSSQNRKNVLKDLKAGMDNTYETEAESEKSKKLGKNTLKPSANLLFGLSYKLSSRINISLEEKQTFIKSDLLDGQQWQVNKSGEVSQSRDFDTYNYLSLGINYSFGSKSIAPLWWVNPLDYAYDELNNPKHMKLPKMAFEDADGDGVIDQLDKEPNTPSGTNVDAHGVSQDSDGDGVPDFKDKQLITPTYCQPSDAEGVGKCPEPSCCDSSRKNSGLNTNCPTDYPSLKFKGNKLTNEIISILSSVAAKLIASPDCKIELTAYPKANKSLQYTAEKRLSLAKNYLIEKLGVSADRISINSVIEGGDENVIDIK